MLRLLLLVRLVTLLLSLRAFCKEFLGGAERRGPALVVVSSI
jgi:hypothetical protein